MTDLSFDLDAILNRGKGRFKKSETLKQGTSHYRILPSIFPTTRQISRFWAVHWLLGPNGKKLQAQCTKYLEGVCPICNTHAETEEEIKRAKANGDDALLEKLKKAEEHFRPSRHVYYNALNSANEVVVLKLSSTVSKQLEVRLVEAARDKGFDAISLTSGVWFEFKKNGIGRDSVMVDYKRDPKTDLRDHTPIPDEIQATFEQKMCNIHNTQGLGIKTFGAKQLADYLRGTPLEMAGAEAGGSSYEESGEDDAPTPPPVAQAPTQTTAPAAAPAAAAAQTQAPTAPAAQTTAPATGGATMSPANKANLDRLNNLLKKR